ncbi:MAG: TlpA family protein disulfide reductase [Muribaculaceae bacterium]|nr:TlpA family protein disulfide reductase [Muribaculaceae bacterium]
MKKFILPAFAILASVMMAKADITVLFPSDASGEFEVESQLINEMVKPRNERAVPDVKGLVIKDGKVNFNVLDGGPAQSLLYTSEREAISLFTMPGDNLVVEVVSMEPLEYIVKGSKLMEDISALDSKGEKIKRDYYAIARSGNPDQKKLDELATSYDILFSDYVKQNPESEASIYALLQLDGEGYLDMLNTLPEGAKSRVLYPLAMNKKERVEKSIEAEKKMKALQSGDVDAPAFTLNNLEGKAVSLSDFKGKWVILDFWGSWCPWCIKGFPSLKDAYKEYAGNLEIIGVDCRDSEDAWRAAVKRYELPWVQVYTNPEQTAALCDAYAVQGFPTKVIVSPEGKIANITVGEDPSFFQTLATLMAK